LRCVVFQASIDYLQTMAEFIPPSVPIINSSKGLHAQTLQYMSQIVPAVLKREQPMAFVSGPSFAKELMQNQPTAIVVASVDPDLQSLFPFLTHH
jgi:glycerol-3-phosphate dehydrogenase (NAD+)